MTGKCILVVICFASISFTAAAQKPLKQVIEDSVYGWTKVYRYGAKSYAPQDANGRHFLPQHKMWVDSFVNWIQASYIPKGGIGDVKRKLLSPYLENGSRKTLPPAYGAWAFTWSMYVDEKGQHRNIQETEIPFGINANEVNGVPIEFLCNDKQYYFMRPGSGEERFSFADPSLRAQYDITRLPQLKPFITFYTKASLYDRNAGLMDAVLLSRNNRMPFLKITKGEYLSLLPAALERQYQQEKAKAEQQWAAGSAREEALAEAVQRKNRRIEKLNACRQRYKDRLSETAELFTAQPDLLFENYADIFEGNGGVQEHFPVYKVDPEMAAACSGEKPQWIIIAWNWNHDDPRMVHMHESIIRNFNFRYVYDFFFDPEKVKGKPYRPLQDPMPPKAPAPLPLSARAKQIKQDPAVLYYEDFSASSPGSKPLRWYSQISTRGVYAVIKKGDAGPENRLWIRGNRAQPWDQPRNFPAAFSLSFDLEVPEGFEWGAKALELVLTDPKAEGVDGEFLELRIRPGFDGRAGEYTINVSSGWANRDRNRAGELAAFSNTIVLRKVHIELSRNGNSLELKVNRKEIMRWPDALKPGIQPHLLWFQQLSTEKEQNTYYLSKIQIRNPDQ